MMEEEKAIKEIKECLSGVDITFSKFRSKPLVNEDYDMALMEMALPINKARKLKSILERIVK